MKKNVLFFSPTFYELPLNDNIKKKYDNLSEVANVTVLAFSSQKKICLLYTSPSPRDGRISRMPSSA